MKVTEVQNILKYWCLELEFTAFTRWFLMLAFKSCNVLWLSMNRFIKGAHDLKEQWP